MFFFVVIQVYFLGKQDQFEVLKPNIKTRIKALSLNPDHVIEHLIFQQKYNHQISSFRKLKFLAKLDPKQIDIVNQFRQTLIEIQQEIIDEEELQYLQSLKELKKSYRESYESLKSIKSEVYFI